MFRAACGGGAPSRAWPARHRCAAAGGGSECPALAHAAPCAARCRPPPATHRQQTARRWARRGRACCESSVRTAQTAVGCGGGRAHFICPSASSSHPVSSVSSSSSMVTRTRPIVPSSRRCSARGRCSDIKVSVGSEDDVGVLRFDIGRSGRVVILFRFTSKPLRGRLPHACS